MSDSSRITILQVNDTHAYLEPHQEMFRVGGKEVYKKAGGFARLAGFIGTVRKEHPDHVIVLDGGDTIHGTHSVVKNKGWNMVEIVNRLAFDGMTAHWEFAYGPDNFERLTKSLDYPMLSINCYREDSDDLVFPPYCVVKHAGLRIGIIGIAATITDKTMPKSFSKGIHLTLGREELPAYIEALKNDEKVNLIIVLSHLGFPQDLQLASEVKGIDILLSAHSHDRIYEPVLVNGAMVVQSGCHGSFIGQLEVTVENDRVHKYAHKLIWMDSSIPLDDEVQSMVTEALGSDRDRLSAVVGKTTTPLHRYRVMESTMDNLLLQAMIERTGTELAFSNGWRFGAPVCCGMITLNDLWNIIPMNPVITTCEITGAELRDMMEENLEHVFSRDPYNQMGGHVKRCLGLNIYFRLQNPAGGRIERFFVGNEPLDKKRAYSACFVTSQGVPDKYGRSRENTSIGAVEALKDYVEKSNSVSAELKGTVVPI